MERVRAREMGLDGTGMDGNGQMGKVEKGGRGANKNSRRMRSYLIVTNIRDGKTGARNHKRMRMRRGEERRNGAAEKGQAAMERRWWWPGGRR